MSTLRLLLIMAAARGYFLSSVDIKQAFVVAELDEPLFMRVPPGYPCTDSQGRKIVYKLRKSLYGLKQAGRCFHQVLVTHLLSPVGSSLPTS